MNNKRSATRWPTILYLAVNDAETGQEYGRLVDVSERGIMMIAGRGTDVPLQIQARIVVPAGLSGAPGFVCSLIRRWRRPDANPAFSLVGFEMQAETATHQNIQQLIDHYSFTGGVRKLVVEAE